MKFLTVWLIILCSIDLRFPLCSYICRRSCRNFDMSFLEIREPYRMGYTMISDVDVGIMGEIESNNP